MSIATELTNLAVNRDAIKAAIEAKNPSVAPTSALSSFPSSIASIPTGGGGGWQKPADWPDLHELLEAYPAPDASQVNAVAVLFDLRGVSSIKIDGGSTRPQAMRFSDDPQTVVDTTISAVAHTFPGNSALGWCIAYSSRPIGVSMRYDLLGYAGTGGTGGYSHAGLCLWVVGVGNADFYGESSSVQCVELDECKFVQARNSQQRAKRKHVFSGASVGTSASYLFQNDFALVELDVSKFDVSAVTTFEAMFTSCSALYELDTSSWDMSSATNVSKIFESCTSLTSVDVSGWNLSSVTTMANAFYNCLSLRTIIGGKTVSSDGSINGSASYFGKGPNADISLSQSPWVEHDSLLFLMYWLPDLSGSTAKTLTLGSMNLARLSADEKAIATAKNWTLA